MIKQRIHGRTKELSIDELRAKFASPQLSYIQTALLFGSRAVGNAHPQSDYDIAVRLDPDYPAPWGVLAQAWVDIGRVLDLADYDYDVIDLDHASNLIHESIEEGFILLKGSVDELHQLSTTEPKNSQ